MSRPRFSSETPTVVISSFDSGASESSESSEYSESISNEGNETSNDSQQKDFRSFNTCSSSESSLSDDIRSDNNDLDHSNSGNSGSEQEGKDGNNTQYFNFWVRFMNYVRHVLTEGVTRVASVAALNPKRAVWGTVLLSFGLLGIGFVTNFKMDLVADRMYTPKDSIIREHQYWVREESGFPAKPRSIRMIVHQDDENVMNMESVEGVFEALDTVKETTGYDKECASSDFEDMNGVKTCRIRGVTLFWNNSADLFRDSVSSNVDTVLQASQTKYPDGSPVDTQEIIGQAERHNSIIVESKAFFIEVALPSTSADLELDALSNLLDLRDEWATRQGNNLRLEVLADSSLENETTRSVIRDIPLVPLVFVIMSAFTCLIFSRRDKVKSQGLLGLGAVVSIFLSLASAYGLMFIFGVNFTSLTQILPFVVFGIGLDDAFIIMGAYNRTDPRKDVVDRIEETMRDIGLSIWLTTVTTVVAFGFGCMSNLPALYWLSYYAFATILFVFFYQITFFVGLIVLDERRIQANRRDCCICMTVQPEVDEEATIGNSDESQQNANVDKLPPAEAETNGNALVRLAMNWYGNFLMKPVVKALVMGAMVFVAVFCAYSTSLFRQEFNVTEMLPSDSYAKSYMGASEQFGQRGWIVPAAYFRNVNQSDVEVQQQMEDYVNDLVGIDAISSQPPLFWLRHFKEFLTYDERLLQFDFNAQVDIFLSYSPFKELYGPHIVRDEDTGDIIASRCVLYMDKVDVNSVKSQLNALNQQREVTRAQPVNSDEDPFDFFLWEYNMFTWDFYAVTAKELTSTTILGVVTVCAIGFVFVPHWSAIFFLAPLIVVLYVDLMGFLQITGNHLNVVSYFALTLSIGLQVDFLMHMMLRYHESPGDTREDKVKAALNSMGASVLIGGTSTMLGVLPLAFSTSELMRTVFIAFIGMVGLGITHGLVCLPVLLSLVGPTATIKEHKPKPGH